MLSPRQAADGLRRFVRAPHAANPPLSDLGYQLIRLKEQLLRDDKKDARFADDFGRGCSGADLLVDVCRVLQPIASSSAESSQKSFWRDSSNTSKKAGVTEADCLECLRAVLDKAKLWPRFIDDHRQVETILHSLSSIQLDSKCSSLQIAISTLSYPDGFRAIHLALTAITAREKFISRLTILEAQLKHGLDTSKLHIQILTVRLLNRLLSAAPNDAFKQLIFAEAAVANIAFQRLAAVERSPLQIAANKAHFSDADVLARELGQWLAQTTARPAGVTNQTAAFNGHFVGSDSDTLRSDRSRRYEAHSRAPKSNVSAMVAPFCLTGDEFQTSAPVARSVEKSRQRADRFPRAAAAVPLPRPQQTHFLSPQRPDADTRSGSSLRSEVSGERQRSANSGKRLPAAPARHFRSPVRKSRSENTVYFNDEYAPAFWPTNRAPSGRRPSSPPVEPIYSPPRRHQLSKSFNDLRHVAAESSSSDDEQRNVRFSPAQTTSTPRPPTSTPNSNTRNKPVRVQGFSYLFPSKPVADEIPLRGRPTAGRSSRPVSLPPGGSTTPGSAPPPTPPRRADDGRHVIQIPIRLESTGRLVQPRRTQQRPSSVAYGDDVQDALSTFDYLNDYESSSRGSRYGVI